MDAFELSERCQFLRDRANHRRHSEVRLVHDASHSARNAARLPDEDGGNGGEVEVDETFIGGKARNMHVAKRLRRILFPRKKDDKAIAFGILERGKEIRTMVISYRLKNTVMPLIREQLIAEPLSIPTT